MLGYFLNKSVTVNANVTPTTAADGSTTYTNSSTGTVSGSFQPANSTEALKYAREHGSLIATLYLPLTYTDGSALTLNAASTVTIDGINYKVLGPAIPDAYGQGYQTVIIEREV